MIENWKRKILDSIMFASFVFRS